MKLQDIKNAELRHFMDVDQKRKTAFFPKKEESSKVKVLQRKGK